VRMSGIFCPLSFFFWFIFMIGTLAELAALPGMPSEPTLRRLVDGDPAFEGIIKRGTGKGDAYEIDLPVAAKYVAAIREREEAEGRARREQLAQLGLDLGLSNPGAEAGFSVADRKALLEEEIVAIKLARLRGELVDKATVEAAIADVLVYDNQLRTSFSARLAKRADVSRPLQIEIDKMMAADQAAFARRMRELAEIEADGNGDSVPVATAAVEDSAA